MAFCSIKTVVKASHLSNLAALFNTIHGLIIAQHAPSSVNEAGPILVCLRTASRVAFQGVVAPCDDGPF